MKEQRKSAKDGGDSTDAMKAMRDRYDRAVEADRDNRELALADLKFVTIPGNQWDESQKKARKNRPCYEFPILRSHLRQVVNDQKKARPGIKVRAVEDGDAEGAELRQGIIRNIESMSNAERAYDVAFELLAATGMGAWRVTTEYSQDDGWDQDIRVRPIKDALTTVWLDPDDFQNPEWAFVEQSMSREAFKAKYPKADVIDFESAKSYGDWFRKDDVRIAEYWRRVPITRTLLLLSDGRTIDKAELDEATVQQWIQEGITVTRERQCKGHKVVSSIVTGKEEIEGPVDSVFSRIPVVVCHANLHFIEGKWYWAGMVRFSRDPQKLLNYNLTTAQEVLAKQHKAAPVLTAKMLEGAGVKAIWDASGAAETPYYPITHDPAMPGGPTYLTPPPVHQAFAAMGQMAIDMLKASDGIFDASVGARSNETSGRAIMARQQEGDTATFDYQDALSFGIQTTGEIILSALPKVYDTPRAMRVLGKDGGEDWVKLYEQTPDGKTINDLSAGKYDVTVTAGANYDTQRMEFVDMLTQLGQSNPAIAAGVPDLIVGAMDFPKADEAAERLKLLLPPPIQQAIAQKDQSPAVMQLQGQLQQMQQMAEEHIAGLQQEMQQLQAKAQSKDDAVLREQNAAKQQEIEWFKAWTDRLGLFQKDGHANDANELAMLKLLQQDGQAEADRQHDLIKQSAEQQHQAGMAEQAAEAAPAEAE